MKQKESVYTGSFLFSGFPQFLNVWMLLHRLHIQGNGIAFLLTF
jgi:hypothetical protein